MRKSVFCISHQIIFKPACSGIREYHKVPKFSDTHLLYCKHSKNQTKRFYHGVILLNDKNGIANSEDPDQTVPLGAV